MSYTVKYTWLHPDQTPRSEHGRVPICEREWSQLDISLLYIVIIIIIIIIIIGRVGPLRLSG